MQLADRGVRSRAQGQRRPVRSRRRRPPRTRQATHAETGEEAPSAPASYLGPRTPVDALLEKYAQDILDTEPPSASASDSEFRAWRAHVRERVGTAIGEIRREDEPDRERIWGRDATIEARGPRQEAPPYDTASGGVRVP